MICTFGLRKIRKRALRRPFKPEPVSRTASTTRKPCLAENSAKRDSCLSKPAFCSPAINPDSFVAQGGHGVNAGSASRGDVAGRERDECKDSRSHTEGKRVARLHVEEQAGHQTSERERGDEANRQTKGGEAAPFEKHLPKNIRGPSAERHADYEFVSPLRDSIGHHSIYADRCQSEREHRKDNEKRKIQTRLGDGIGDELLHGGDVVERQLLVHSEDLVADSTGNAGRVKRGAHDEGHLARRESAEERLGVRQINLFPAFDVERVMPHMPDDAYDGAPTRGPRLDVGHGIDGYALADGVAMRPEAMREIRIDNGNERGARVIGIVQQAAAYERNLHRLKVARRGRALIDLHKRKVAQLRKPRDIGNGGVFEEY